MIQSKSDKDDLQAGRAMADYRLFVLNKASQSVTLEQFAADDDTLALSRAREQHPDSDLELWKLGHRVALILTLEPATGS